MKITQVNFRDSTSDNAFPGWGKVLQAFLPAIFLLILARPAFGDEIILPDPASVKPHISLVLSGGGSRGFSQVGVLRELEQAGIIPSSIVGTSIGAIVGGLYSAGYTAAELDSVIRAVDWESYFSLRDNSKRQDLFIDQKIIEDRSLIRLEFKDFIFVLPEAISEGADFYFILHQLFWNAPYKSTGSFDDLKIPFRAVASDLIRGESVALSDGNLITAVRASATVPLRYTPVRMDSMILVDGGVLSNVPVKHTLEFSPDIIIAVNTTSPLLSSAELNTPWNIADQVVSMSMKQFEKQHSGMADYIIKPDLKGRKNDDFAAIDTLIEIGREAAALLIDTLKYRDEKFTDSVMSSRLDRASQMLADTGPAGIAGFYSIDSSKIARAVFNHQNLKPLLKDIIYSGKYSKIRVISSDGRIDLKAHPYQKIRQIRINSDRFTDIRDSIENIIELEILPKKLYPGLELEIEAKVLREYQKRAFSFASINNFKISDETIELELDPGIISFIEITGNEATKEFLILREIDYSIGDPINPIKISEGWENLLNTGLFRHVEIKVEESPGKGTGLKVNVVESGTQAVIVGARIDNSRHTQVGIDLVQENLFNFGLRATARFAGGSRNQWAGIILENPKIMNTELGFTASGYYGWKSIYQYDEKAGLPRDEFEKFVSDEWAFQRYGAMLSLNTRVEKKGVLSGGIRYEMQRSYDRDSSIREDFYHISTIKLGALFDTENRIDFPTEGEIIDISLETSILPLTEIVGFSKARFSYKSNISFSNITITPGLFFGMADKTLPYPEFFSLGGQENFFGYRENANMGRQVFRTFLNYRYKAPFRIFFDTYFYLRYDLGGIWTVPEQIKISKLRHGIGASI
ncbi:MAG: patatin-like phospholipase family protein, partial [Bacteroidota bacterium]